MEGGGGGRGTRGTKRVIIVSRTLDKLSQVLKWCVTGLNITLRMEIAFVVHKLYVTVIIIF